MHSEFSSEFLYENLSSFIQYNQTFNYTTLNVTTIEEFQYKLWQKIMFACFMVPVIFFSIFGNIVVIIAIVKYEYLQISGNIFLASLAVADCSIGILVMPLNALQLLTGKWYLKAFMCRFWFSCDVLFSTASILHLFCVSVDRFLSISNKYAFRYQAEDATKSWRIRIMIGSVWIISALISFIPIQTNLFTTTEYAIHINNLDNQISTCFFIVNFPYRMVSSSISFWLPGFGMILFYCLVMRKAIILSNETFKIYKQMGPRRSSAKANGTSFNVPLENKDNNKRHSSYANENELQTLARKTEEFNLLQQNENKENGNGTFRNDEVPSHSQLRRSRLSSTLSMKEGREIFKREYKALKTLGTVIAVFCICWFFFFLNYTICNDVFLTCTDIFGEMQYIDDILFWIGYSNSMINPFLYNFTNQDFRKAFRSLLKLNRYERTLCSCKLFRSKYGVSKNSTRSPSILSYRNSH